MFKLIKYIVAGILGFLLAKEFIPGVSLDIIPDQSNFLGIKLTAFWQILIIVGAIWGSINFFLKPILKVISFPLRIITFGLFTLALNVLLLWLVDLIFPELKVEGVAALLLTTIIILVLNWLLGILSLGKK